MFCTFAENSKGQACCAILPRKGATIVWRQASFFLAIGSGAGDQDISGHIRINEEASSGIWSTIISLLKAASSGQLKVRMVLHPTSPALVNVAHGSLYPEF